MISVHGGDVLGVADRWRGGRAAVERAFGGPARARQLGGDRRPQPRARRRGRRASCTSAPTCPPPVADRRRRRSSPSATWSPASATATSCARSGCCATRIPSCAGSIVGDGPGARAAGAARRRARARPTASSFRGALAPAEALRGARSRRRLRAARASRRRSASPTSRRWRAACPAIGSRGEPARRRSPPPAAGCGSSRPATRRRSPPSCGALLDDAALAARARRRRPRERRARFTWDALRARDRRRLRGRAAVSTRPSCSSPTTRRRSASARSRPCTSARTSSFALIGGDVRHGGGGAATALPFPVVFPRERAVARLAASGASAPWWPGSRAASRCPPRTPARARGACRSCCGRRSGATRARAAHALSYLPLRHIYRHADAIATYGPHVSAYVRAKGARGPVFEAPQSVDDAFWARRRARAARRLPGPVRGPTAREKGAQVLLRPGGRRACGTAALVLVGDGPLRARAVATGASARGPRAPGRTAQLLRGQRRCGRTVGPHARLPRAVGAGRQRSLPPGSSRDRHRRRRSRRRRARAPRAHRARRPRRRRGRAAPPRCGACATIPRCARGSAPPAREAVAALHARRLGGRACRGAGGRRRREGAASVNRRCDATMFLAVLLRCSSPPRRRARATATRSSRDCADDGVLQGNYTAVRDARRAQASCPRTSTSTPTAATCSRARSAAASLDSGGGGGARRRRRRRGPGGGTAAAPAARPDARAAQRALDHGRARSARDRADAAGRRPSVVPGAAGARAGAARHELSAGERVARPARSC